MAGSSRGVGSVCALTLLALLACKQGDKEEAKGAATAVATPTPAAPAATPAPTPTETAALDVDKKGIPLISSGRSNPPTVAEWSAARELNTQEANSRAKDCFMKIVREWLKVHCEGEIREVTDKDGIPKGAADYFDSIRPGKAADFVIRLKRPTTMKMRIHRNGNRASLFVNWPASADRPANVALSQIKE
jgi:hypothetical protein